MVKLSVASYRDTLSCLLKKDGRLRPKNESTSSEVCISFYFRQIVLHIVNVL